MRLKIAREQVWPQGQNVGKQRVKKVLDFQCNQR